MILLYLTIAVFGLLVSCASNTKTVDAETNPDITAASKNTAGEPDFEFRNISGGSLEQTEEILHNSLLGHLVVTGDYPYSTPVNFVYENKSIYFPLRKDAEGKICDIITKDNRVCFAVDNYAGNRWHSIHIFGKAAIIDDKDCLRKYHEVIGKSGFTYDSNRNNLVFVRITPDLVTVRLNYGIPYWYLGKLNRTEDGKLTPKMKLPAAGATVSAEGAERTSFTGKVEFVGLPAGLADIVLRSSHSGRINTLGDDGPYSVPLNCSFPKGKIYIHSKKNGLKVMNIAKKQNVSFDVEWLWNGQEWLTVTVEGKAKLLPADEGIEAMQYFSEFLTSPDGFISAEFKPEPGKKIGSDRMMQRMAVIEITPERVITRSVPIPEGWLSKMPSELSK